MCNKNEARSCHILFTAGVNDRGEERRPVLPNFGKPHPPATIMITTGMNAHIRLVFHRLFTIGSLGI